MKNLILLILLASSMSYGQNFERYTLNVITERGFPNVAGFGPTNNRILYRGYRSNANFAPSKDWDSTLRTSDNVYVLNVGDAFSELSMEGKQYIVMPDVLTDYTDVFTGGAFVESSTVSEGVWSPNTEALHYFTHNYRLINGRQDGINSSGIQLRGTIDSDHSSSRYRWVHYKGERFIEISDPRIDPFLNFFTPNADDRGEHTWVLIYGQHWELGRFTYTR